MYDDGDCTVYNSGHGPDNPGLIPILCEKTVGKVDGSDAEPINGSNRFHSLLKFFFFPTEIFLLEKLGIGILRHTGQDEEIDGDSDDQKSYCKTCHDDEVGHLKGGSGEQGNGTCDAEDDADDDVAVVGRLVVFLFFQSKTMDSVSSFKYFFFQIFIRFEPSVNT